MPMRAVHAKKCSSGSMGGGALRFHVRAGAVAALRGDADVGACVGQADGVHLEIGHHRLWIG